MQIIVSLIDKAAESCGSQAKLAARLEVTPQFLSAIKKGKSTCPPELAGLLAEIADEEIAPAVLDAVMDGFSKTERGQRVKEAMQKAFLAGAVATFATFATAADAKAPTPPSINSLTKYASYLLAALNRFRLSRRVRGAYLGFQKVQPGRSPIIGSAYPAAPARSV